MKTTTRVLLQTIPLALLLLSGGSAFGATEERPTRGKVELAQREFSGYINSAEYEYNKALHRKNEERSKLWQNNVANSQIKLAITFTLMGGNEKVKGHESMIAALKTFLGIGEKTAVKRLETNYFALRTRAYALQDKLNPLIEQLDPEVKKWLLQKEKDIKTSSNPDGIGREAALIVEGADRGGKVIVGSGSGGSQLQDLGNGYKFDPKTGIVYGPDGKPLAGASWDPDGKRIKLAGGYSIDPATGNVYGPDGVLIDGAKLKGGRISLPGGYSLDPATGTIYGSDGKALPGAKVVNGSVVLPSGSDSGAGSGPSPSVSSKFVDSSGKSIQLEKDWFDAQGNLRAKRVRMTYTDFDGGRINSEVVLNSNAQKRPDGSFAVAPAEEEGSKIEWALIINASDRKPAGQGFSVTCQLLNEGTPKDAEFEVTAWEGPDGRKETSDKQFAVTFPKPGTYEIKAYGRTLKYDNKFTISLPIEF